MPPQVTLTIRTPCATPQKRFCDVWFVDSLLERAVFVSLHSIKLTVLCVSAGDGWQQPSLLLRHDSVDSGVAKGRRGGLAGGSCWKEAHPTWHGAAQDRHHHPGRQPKRHGTGGGDRQGGHRQRNGNFHPRKGTPGAPYQDKFPNEEHSGEDKLKFVEEDFVSSNLILEPL